ncbi:MAG: YihY/virulence factor BrkB family protein [Candidatus Brocadiaceae bacterium]|nr:YihY/virulence factor BrkB family protein [Candidatus Brocadiaceae bacterium]
MKSPFSFYNKSKVFIETDLWAVDLRPLTFKNLFFKFLRFCYLVTTEFIGGRCPLKASALTFISLISLVPLLAFILSVSKGLGAEKALNNKIDTYITSLPGGKEASLFTYLKQHLFKQIDSLNFSKPSIREELLKIIENFDKTTSSDISETYRPNARKQEPDQYSEYIKIKDALEDYKIELSVIVNSIDLNRKDAGKGLKERFENVKFSIPQNIGSSALQFKEYIMYFVDRTSFGYLGTIGLLVLLSVVIRTLGQIEMSFNDVWKIKKCRSIFRKFTDYTSMLIILPILLLASTTVTAVLTDERLVAFLHKVWIGKLYLNLLGWGLPIIVLWIAFISMYMFLPNTRVKIAPGIIGGIAGGTVFYILQAFFLKGQIGLSRYNVIYGAFAAIPFFLVWLQTSWTIVLLGAVISYVIQNINTIRPGGQFLKINYASREILGLIIMERICAQFFDGKGEKWSSERLSDALNVPFGLIQDIISGLLKASLILEIPTEKGIYYVPGRDMDSIFITEVLHAMRNAGESLELIPRTLHDQRIARFVEDTQNKIKQGIQVTFKDIIQDEKPSNIN